MGLIYFFTQMYKYFAAGMAVLQFLTGLWLLYYAKKAGIPGVYRRKKEEKGWNRKRQKRNGQSDSGTQDMKKVGNDSETKNRKGNPAKILQCRIRKGNPAKILQCRIRKGNPERFRRAE